MSTRSKSVKLAQKKARQGKQGVEFVKFQGKQGKKKPVTQGKVGAKKKKGRKNKRKGRTSMKGSSMLTPARSVVWLKYVSTQSLGGGVHTSYGYPLVSNGAFAVDPSAPAGYTTTPGFSVRAAQYASYRVRGYKGRIIFENTTAVPADTFVCHTNTTLGAASGGSAGINGLQFAANRPQINTIVPIQSSAGGPNKAVHRFKHSIASIAGESIMQPGYKCLTNTVPALPTYIVFGYQAAANLALMTITVDLMMEVEFLDYIDTLTSFSSEEDRLASLGKPQISKCAGCKAVEQIEFASCPDPQCVIEDTCTNCGYSRRCSANCQSSRCPYKEDTVVLRPPVLRVDSKSKVCDPSFSLKKV